MFKNLGWSALIYDADWCHFVENQDGLYISDDRFMCETLDDSKDSVSIECDDNDSTDQRKCHVLFRQKATDRLYVNENNESGTTELEVTCEVIQSGGTVIIYTMSAPNQIGLCATYDEFIPLISVQKNVSGKISTLNKDEYVILSPTRSEFAIMPDTGETSVEVPITIFIDDNGERISGSTRKEGESYIVSTSSETLSSISISGSVTADISSAITETISYSAETNMCQCVFAIEPSGTTTCEGGLLSFGVKKYNCMPDRTITHYDIEIDTSEASAITNVIKEYFETSTCDNSQVGYSAVTESGLTNITGWEIINNQQYISPVSGDFSEGRIINLTAQEGISYFNLKLTSELSGITSSKIISFNI